MRARFVFGIVFFVYLWGPARAPGAEADPAAVRLATAPFATLVRIAYPLAAEADQDRWAGRLAGAFYAAGAVGLTYATLLRTTPVSTSLVLALATAFATPLWSWASRGANQEAPAAFAMGAALWLATRGRPTRPALRLSVAAAVVTLCVIVAQRAAAFSGASWTEGFRSFDPTLFAAYFISPGLGLFLFVATAAGIVTSPGRAALILTLLLVADIAVRPDPWGPPGFGPVWLTPLVPLIAQAASGLGRTAIAVGLLWTLPIAFAHGYATFRGGHTWSERRLLATQPEAVWDLRDHPFRDLWKGAPPPDLGDRSPRDFRMPVGPYSLRAGQPVPWMVHGWEEPEAEGMWASETESWIALAVPPGDYQLTLTASAPLWGTTPQRVGIVRPGYPPLDVTFKRGLWDYETIDIPFRSERAVSVIVLRPAHVVFPGRGDVRRATLFVKSLLLTSSAPKRRP